ncbi:MAG: glycosyltransferase [Desulfobulbaceae bacterium]|nr:MAG: glycosyltransferase [Desulfobulbaceae bacterium]
MIVQQLKKIKQFFLLLVTLAKRSELPLIFHLESIDASYYLHGSPIAGIRDPHPLFDSYYYRRKYMSPEDNQHPFAHYLKTGIKKGYRPGPYFDPVVFLSRFRCDTDENPLVIYNEASPSDRLCTGLLFNASWYVSQTPSLARAGLDPLFHYRLFGIQEQKRINPLMDAGTYRNDHSAVLADGNDPVSLYLLEHQEEKSSLFPHFDPVYYREQYGNSAHDRSPLEDYLGSGIEKKHYPQTRISKLVSKPLISVIVPVFNPTIASLQNCIESVLYQSYPHWELCLIDDGSDNQQVRVVLEEWRNRDHRIKVRYLEVNGGISVATNQGISEAEGNYIGFLDNDDELTVDCLQRIAETINEVQPEVIYTDEILIGEDGRYYSKFRKPEYNYGLLLSHNYMTHFTVVSAHQIRRAGGLRTEYDGAQDYDLMLRLSEQTKNISHIPRALYLWRASQTSTSINHDQKQYAHDAGRRALENHLSRSGPDAIVADGPVKYNYTVQRVCKKPIRPMVCIWPQDFNQPKKIALPLQDLIDSQGGEVVYLADWISLSLNSQESPMKLSLTSMLDRLIHESERELVVLLSDSIQTCSSRWLDTLAGNAEQPEVAVACGRISYDGADGKSYKLPDLEDETPLHFFYFLCNGSLHLNGLHSMQDVGFASWNNVMICRSNYLRVGGFDTERYPMLFGLVDLCNRLRQSGERIIYHPDALVEAQQEMEPEWLSSNQPDLRQEMGLFKSSNQNLLQYGPPYYNPEVLADHGFEQAKFSHWISAGSSN